MKAQLSLVIGAIVVIAALGAVSIALLVNPEPGPGQGPVTISGEVVAFNSADEFKAYIEEAGALESGYLGGSWGIQSRTFATNDMMVEDSAAGAPVAAGGESDGKGAGESEPSRVSDTNVQVQGIDEPDIVKTDGINIYFSGNYWNTNIIKAFPAEDLEEISDIEENGEMLLFEDTLIIFTYNKIIGYDVSDEANPEQIWDIEINGSFVDARLYQGKIYLITRNNINRYNPCPVMPLTRNGVAMEISCSNVYHPIEPVATDVTYNAMVVEPGTGDVSSAVSFVGSSWQSSVYMSENGIYVTYVYQGDILKMMKDFLTTEGKDLFPRFIIEQLERLDTYDISLEAKMLEFQNIFGSYLSTLSNDDQLKLQNELNDRMGDYMDKHKRELVQTGIAKIGLDMEVKASGAVPGTLLNQFSMDEYNGNLRIATTVSGSWQFNTESANDVYVLDSQLNIIGSIQDLGLTERVYSARFIGDNGYLVTFRQTDPFYVLDLSNPASPELKGELKIPGYSSYLHPISDDLILGIGKENSDVKISLFDVSDPTNPTEADKYTLDEYWSDIISTHHAFLLDKDHGVFFVPGSRGGYVFSYENNDISLVKAVADVAARRAIYLDDYMYIIGSDEIVVLDENSWEEVNSIELETEYPYPYYGGGIEPMIGITEEPDVSPPGDEEDL